MSDFISPIKEQNTFPTPKHKIGDTVYCPRLAHSQTTLPCPDCLGTHKWKMMTPAGVEHTLDCPRCRDGYATRLANGVDLPSLKYPCWKPFVERLTVGSIRIDTANQKEPVSYMCNETGVGSGSIWDERQLHTDEADALDHAQRMANESNARPEYAALALKASHFAYLQWDEAARAASWSFLYDAWGSARDLREAIEEVTSSEGSMAGETKENIIDHLEYALQEKSWRTPHPLDAVVSLARKVTDCDEDRTYWALREAVIALDEAMKERAAPEGVTP